jgi:hypothetical protein
MTDQPTVRDKALRRSDTLEFKGRTRTVEYGDHRKFVEYQILMLDLRGVVGIESGPGRETTTRSNAIKAARARIRTLKSHRLFAVRVTKKHIDDGDARNCFSCAISQALWHNQERMGLSKYEYNFRVVPYACMTEADGLVLEPKYGGDGALHIPDDELPDMVSEGKGYKGRIPNEGMIEWAMEFDDWGDSRCMSLSEWREERGYDDGERPYRPSPASFVLDLDAMVPLEN